MASLTDRLDTIMQEARKLSEEQAVKQYANKNSLDGFISFLEEYKPDGMKKYARTCAQEKEKFECLIRAKIVIPGDIVCFFPKVLDWIGICACCHIWRWRRCHRRNESGAYSPAEGAVEDQQTM